MGLHVRESAPRGGALVLGSVWAGERGGRADETDSNFRLGTQSEIRCRETGANPEIIRDHGACNRPLGIWNEGFEYSVGAS